MSVNINPKKTGQSNIDDQEISQRRQNNNYIVFGIASRKYGVEVDSISEIIEYGRVLKVPMTPSCIHGVVYLRGNMIAVIDIASLFSRPKSQPDARSSIVIIDCVYRGRELRLGFLVESIERVVELSLGDIELRPEFSVELDSGYTRGIGIVEKEMVTLLDIENVLSVESIMDLVESQYR